MENLSLLFKSKNSVTEKRSVFKYLNYVWKNIKYKITNWNINKGWTRDPRIVWSITLKKTLQELYRVADNLEKLMAYTTK
jgi:hypothetical protein